MDLSLPLTTELSEVSNPYDVVVLHRPIVRLDFSSMLAEDSGFKALTASLPR